ncbi:CoA-binding protein [Hyphomicrobium denitrificans 1NES1]|uniref:CoA-binding protein n=1 Tax=Hyphomicrobium denitrificans 1NES1 TaxID=670307 RepID=N0B4W4_9HYPH|nr:CoA-binding protein [Hyphomicrobium denitrificans]AGK58013.1 CoA-binding protein [Hyphomicrobium denitrificans 1NES1]
MSIDGLSDTDIRAILGRVKTFAVVGASAKPDRPSHQVMGFLIKCGYQVRPVNPGIADKAIHGQKVYASLADVPAPVDVIDVFRASAAALQVVRDAIAVRDKLGASVIWMQLGVINEQAAAEARAGGFTVVMDRCPKIEMSRLSEH